MDVIRESFYEMLAELRPNVVQLADSWDLPDRALGSVLGRRDGNVYPALMEWAKKSPLNKSQVRCLIEVLKRIFFALNFEEEEDEYKEQA